MTDDTTLTLSRTLPAPRDLVWACWTDPQYVSQWFMPAPHKALSAVIDLRPGGEFTVEMEVDGNVMKDPGVILEVVPTRKLVFTDTYAPGWIPKPDPFMTAIIELSDQPEGTRYDVTIRHRSAEAAKQHADMGFYDGWGKVAEQLGIAAKGLEGDEEGRAMLLTRHIDATPEQVWRAWTDPELLPRWFGPDGFTCETKSIDVKPGGSWRFDMLGHGRVFPNRHDYQVLDRPNRIVFHMNDDSEGAANKVVEVTLTPEGAGTRVQMRMIFANPEDRLEALGFGALELGYTTLGKLAHVARIAPQG